MKLREIGDFANLIAAIGVIVSLLFVAYEVRENTAEARTANRHELVRALRELTVARAQTPSLAAAIEMVHSGEQLTPAQQSQYFGYFVAVITSHEEAYLEYLEGRLDEQFMEARLTGMINAGYLQNEFDLGRWNNMKETGSRNAEFVRAVDAKLAERIDQAILN